MKLILVLAFAAVVVCAQAFTVDIEILNHHKQHPDEHQEEPSHELPDDTEQEQSIEIDMIVDPRPDDLHAEHPEHHKHPEHEFKPQPLWPQPEPIQPEEPPKKSNPIGSAIAAIADKFKKQPLPMEEEHEEIPEHHEYEHEVEHQHETQEQPPKKFQVILNQVLHHEKQEQSEEPVDMENGVVVPKPKYPPPKPIRN